MRMRTLLLISPFFHPNVGGVETRLMDLVRTLDKYGHRVEVLAYQPMTSGGRGPSRERFGKEQSRCRGPRDGTKPYCSPL